jgi:salicylate hydroxylase
MHTMLMDSATGTPHTGIPATLKVNHKCVSVDHAAGVVTFQNGVIAKHDLRHTAFIVSLRQKM